MSKGLEAFERISNHIEVSFDYSSDEDLSIIEKELKRLEDLEYAFSSLVKAFNSLSKDNEKELKALEIIREKRVQVGDLLYSPDLESYNKERYRLYQLTQEEYDLLKEVML